MKVSAKILGYAFATLALVSLYGEALFNHASAAIRRVRYQEDILQQIIPFLRYHTPSSFPNDYIVDYFLACMPIGFSVLYIGAAKAMDPVFFSTLLPYALLAIVLFGVAVAAKRFTGPIGALLAIGFCLSADVYLDRMSGGLARAFGFPIIALGLAALVHGKIKLLAVVTVVGAAFYASASVPCAVALAGVLILLPKKDRGEATDWSLGKRIGFLALTGAFTVAVLLPNVIALKEYGSVITPSDINEFPEAGPGGRYAAAERAPFLPFLVGANRMASKFLFSVGQQPETRLGFSGKPYWDKARVWGYAANKLGKNNAKNRSWTYLLVFVAIGLAFRARHDGAARRLLVFAFCLWPIYEFSALVAPHFYLPERYLVYPLPPLMTVLFVAALSGWALMLGKLPRLRSQPRIFQTALVLIVCGYYLLVFGGRGNSVAGLYGSSRAEERPLFQALEQLPADALIAGWPSGIVNEVPLFAKRKILLSFETHQAFHSAYALAMRERANATFDAYFATSVKPLEHLRDRFGVTHFVVDRLHFSQLPSYFKPFQGQIKRLTAGGKLPQTKKFWAEFGKEDQYIAGRYLVLDLKKMEVIQAPV